MDNKEFAKKLEHRTRQFGMSFTQCQFLDFNANSLNIVRGEDLDKCEAIHAEQNALLQCKDVNEIDRVYTTLEPCVHCTKLLLNTSANQIIYGEKYVHNLARELWESSGRGYTFINKETIQGKIN